MKLNRVNKQKTSNKLEHHMALLEFSFPSLHIFVTFKIKRVYTCSVSKGKNAKRKDALARMIRSYNTKNPISQKFSLQENLLLIQIFPAQTL